MASTAFIRYLSVWKPSFGLDGTLNKNMKVSCISKLFLEYLKGCCYHEEETLWKLENMQKQKTRSSALYEVPTSASSDVMDYDSISSCIIHCLLIEKKIHGILNEPNT